MQLYATVIDGVPQFDLTSQPGPNRYPVIGWLWEETWTHKNNPPEPGQPWASATFDSEAQAVVVEPIERPLAEVKEMRQALFYRIAAEEIDTLVAAYTPAEVSTFLMKEAEAQKYQLTNDTLDAPWLVVEAAQRQVSVADLAATILSKAAIYRTAVQAICGKRGRLCDQVDAAQTVAAVLEVTW